MQKLLATKEAVKVKTYSGSGSRQFSGKQGSPPGRIYYSLLQLVQIEQQRKVTYQILLAQITFQIASILKKNNIAKIADLPKGQMEKFLIKEIKRAYPASHPKKIIATYTDVEVAKQAFVEKGKALS